MDEATLAGIDVAAVKRRLHSALIAVSNNLNKPYIDASDKTPWSVFVQPMVRVVDDAIDTLVAEVRRLSAALAEQQRENERQADLIAEFRKRDESQDRIRDQLTAERDALQVDNSVQFDRAEAAEAALADLRAKVEALPRRMLNTIDPAGDGYTVRIDCVNAVRALAAAPSGEPNTEEKP